jgi:hypothetical protein
MHPETRTYCCHLKMEKYDFKLLNNASQIHKNLSKFWLGTCKKTVFKNSFAKTLKKLPSRPKAEPWTALTFKFLSNVIHKFCQSSGF